MATIENCVMCTTGKMTTAAGIYYKLQHKDEKRGTEAFEDTPVQEDPVQVPSSSILHSTAYKDRQMVGATHEMSPAVSEEQIKKMLSSIQLNNEELCVLVLMVPDNLICEMHKESELKSKVSRTQLSEILMEKDNSMTQLQKAYSILKEEFEKLKEVAKQKEDSLIASLAEAEVRAITAEGSCTHLVRENSSLKDKIQTLQSQVEMKEARSVCEDDHGLLPEAGMKNEKEFSEGEGGPLNSAEQYVLYLMDKVMELENLLDESQRECAMKSRECEQGWKAQKALKESVSEIQMLIRENEEIRKECEKEHHILKEKFDKLEGQLHETCRMDEEKLNECEQGWKDQKALKERDSVMQVMKWEYEDLRTEYEREQQAHHILREKFDELNGELHETHWMYEEKINEYEKEQQTHHILREKFDELNGELSETRRMYEEKLKECEKEQQAHNILKKEFDEVNETCRMFEEKLNALAEPEKTAKKAEDYCVQLEQEMVILKDSIQTLHGSVEMLKGQLHERDKEQEKEQNKKPGKKTLRTFILKLMEWFKKFRSPVHTEKDSVSEEKVKEQEKEQDKKSSKKTLRTFILRIMKWFEKKLRRPQK